MPKNMGAHFRQIYGLALLQIRLHEFNTLDGIVQKGVGIDLLRIGEALALTWDDIDFDTGIISIYKTMAYKPGEDGRYDYRIGPPKTAAGTREVPMLDEVKAAL